MPDHKYARNGYILIRTPNQTRSELRALTKATRGGLQQKQPLAMFRSLSPGSALSGKLPAPEAED